MFIIINVIRYIVNNSKHYHSYIIYSNCCAYPFAIGELASNTLQETIIFFNCPLFANYLIYHSHAAHFFLLKNHNKIPALPFISLFFLFFRCSFNKKTGKYVRLKSSSAISINHLFGEENLPARRIRKELPALRKHDIPVSCFQAVPQHK